MREKRVYYVSQVNHYCFLFSMRFVLLEREVSVLYHPYIYPRLSSPWSLSIADLVNDKEVLCGGALVRYAKSFIELTDVLIDPSKGIGRRGGENISDVINQTEDSELFKLSKGFFNLNCSRKNETGKGLHLFSGRDHLEAFVAAIDFTWSAETTGRKFIKRPTVTVQRIEYTNLFHAITDWYNVFLMYLIFNLGPDSSNILWLDGHPKWGLDQAWKTLFGEVMRVGHIEEPVRSQFVLKSIRTSVNSYSFWSIHT